MRRAVAWPVVLAAALLPAGCATDTRGELRRAVAGITDDANARDADGVRDGADALLARLDGDVRSGELTSEEAARIAGLAQLLRDRAALLEPAPVPEPEPEPEPTEEPEPSVPPSPPRSPSPPPSPSPSPSPPSPPPAPDPDPTETDESIVPGLPGG